jgi:hypothetical protein
VRSGLVELPVPPPAAGDDVSTQGLNGNPDPWRRIFRPTSRPRNDLDLFGLGPPVAPDENAPRGGLEEMGMYDAEDGGIYRCIDCMHEIWGGACTGCRRVYAGHEAADGEDGLGGDDDEPGPADPFGGLRGRQRMLRDFIGMLARGGRGALDLDVDDESDLGFGGPGVFGDPDDEDEDDDDDDDNPGIPETMAERYRQLALDGLPGALVAGPPMMYPLYPGEVMYADFTDEDEDDDEDVEAGIARIEEEADEEGYESSFIDDNGNEERNGEPIVGAQGQRPLTIWRPHRPGPRLIPAPRVSLRSLMERGSDSDLIVLSEGEEDGGGIAVEDVIRNVGRGVRLDASGADRRSVSRRGAGSRPIVIISDESDSSDIEIIGQPSGNERRGGRLRRRRS